jgi:hypothetical protein
MWDLQAMVSIGGDMGNLDVVTLTGFERIKKGDEGIGS